MTMKALIEIDDVLQALSNALRNEQLIDKEGFFADYYWNRIQQTLALVHGVIDLHFEAGRDTIVHIQTEE